MDFANAVFGFTPVANTKISAEKIVPLAVSIDFRLPSPLTFLTVSSGKKAMFFLFISLMILEDMSQSKWDMGYLLR